MEQKWFNNPDFSDLVFYSEGSVRPVYVRKQVVCALCENLKKEVDQIEGLKTNGVLMKELQEEIKMCQKEVLGKENGQQERTEQTQKPICFTVSKDREGKCIVNVYNTTYTALRDFLYFVYYEEISDDQIEQCKRFAKAFKYTKKVGKKKRQPAIQVTPENSLTCLLKRHSNKNSIIKAREFLENWTEEVLNVTSLKRDRKLMFKNFAKFCKELRGLETLSTSENYIFIILLKFMRWCTKYTNANAKKELDPLLKVEGLFKSTIQWKWITKSCIDEVIANKLGSKRILGFLSSEKFVAKYPEVGHGGAETANKSKYIGIKEDLFSKIYHSFDDIKIYKNCVKCTFPEDKEQEKFSVKIIFKRPVRVCKIMMHGWLDCNFTVKASQNLQCYTTVTKFSSSASWKGCTDAKCWKICISSTNNHIKIPSSPCFELLTKSYFSQEECISTQNFPIEARICQRSLFEECKFPEVAPENTIKVFKLTEKVFRADYGLYQPSRERNLKERIDILTYYNKKFKALKKEVEGKEKSKPKVRFAENELEKGPSMLKECKSAISQKSVKEYLEKYREGQDELEETSDKHSDIELGTDSDILEDFYMITA